MPLRATTLWWLLAAAFATGAAADVCQPPLLTNPVDGTSPISADFDGVNGPDIALLDRPDLHVLLNDGTGNFPSVVSYYIAGRPEVGERILVADLDGRDGPDILGVRKNGDEIYALLNDGLGGMTLEPAQPLPMESFYALAELDGNPGEDLLIRGSAALELQIVVNRGDGTFESPRTLPLGGFPYTALVADLDLADGLDIVTNSPDGEILLNNGDGTFRPAPPLGNRSIVAIADFDGQFGPDLLASWDSQGSILFNTGGGTFSAPVVVVGASLGSRVEVADLDQSGRPDLLLTRSASPPNPWSVDVYRNRGDGTFDAPTTYELRVPLQSVSPMGLFGLHHPTGAPDFLYRGSDRIHVLANRGDGTFGDTRDYYKYPRAGTPIPLDADGDGDLDLATSGLELAVLLNRGDGTLITAPRWEFSTEALADLDGDGKLDLIVTPQDGIESHWVDIYLNRGDGTFPTHPTTSLSTDAYPVAVATGDVDGRNGTDIIVGTFDVIPFTFSVFLNDGTGQFPTSDVYPDSGYSMALVDLDGDDDLDFLVEDSFGYGVRVWRNRGDGTFERHGAVQSLTFVSWLTAADVDGRDGPDIIITTPNDGVEVFLNRGDATFLPGQRYGTPTSSGMVASADLDRAKGPDILIVRPNSDAVAVLLNNGDGTFAAETTYPVGDEPRSVAIVDYDEANGPDLVVTNWRSDDVSTLANLGDGSFAAEQRIPMFDRPGRVLVGDLDGADPDDIVISNFYTTHVLLGCGDSWLLRNDAMTDLSPPLAPPRREIFIGQSTTRTTLRLAAPGAEPSAGEGAFPEAPGSPDGDDAYVDDFAHGDVDPELGVVFDTTRPLIFYQVNESTNLLRLTRDSGNVRVYY